MDQAQAWVVSRPRSRRYAKRASLKARKIRKENGYFVPIVVSVEGVIVLGFKLVIVLGQSLNVVLKARGMGGEGVLPSI